MANYTKYAVKNTLIVLILSLLAAFIGYLVRLVLARWLTVEEFGLFNSVFAFLGMLGIFKSLGFDKALIKFIPEFKHQNKNDFIKSSIIYVSVIQLIMNTLIIIGVYLFADYLSLNFFHSPKAQLILKLMAISFFLDSFVMILKFAFQGFKEMTYYSGIDLVRMLLVLVVILIGFKLNYGILSPVAAYIITHSILILIFGWILLNRVFPEFIKLKFVFDKNLLKKISKYGIFVVETTAAGMLLYYTDILTLTYFSDLVSVGLYSVALPTAKVLMVFPRAIGGILLPLTSELWIKKSEKMLSAGFESLYKYLLILIVPLVFIMFSFTELLLKILYGEGYIGAAYAMKILSIGMIFAVLFVINLTFFAGIGQPKISAKITYIGAIFNLVLNLILIPIIGMIGAALATTVSYILMSLMGLFYINRFIKLSFPIRNWLSTLAAGLIFTFTIWILKSVIALQVWVETGIVLAISIMVYIAFLFLFKAINLRELKYVYYRITR